MDHLASIPAYWRRIILDAIDTHLRHAPTVPTRRRKPLRPNPFASWELRVDRYRVYYDVKEADGDEIVVILAVGIKRHNRLFIGGREIVL